MTENHKEKYEAVIGLEVHAQLLQVQKPTHLTNEFGAAPNSNISAITLGHPGTLPVVNKNRGIRHKTWFSNELQIADHSILLVKIIFILIFLKDTKSRKTLHQYVQGSLTSRVKMEI